jgi:hypothetical protein
MRLKFKWSNCLTVHFNKLIVWKLWSIGLTTLYIVTDGISGQKPTQSYVGRKCIKLQL